MHFFNILSHNTPHHPFNLLIVIIRLLEEPIFSRLTVFFHSLPLKLHKPYALYYLIRGHHAVARIIGEHVPSDIRHVGVTGFWFPARHFFFRSRTRIGRKLLDPTDLIITTVLWLQREWVVASGCESFFGYNIRREAGHLFR